MKTWDEVYNELQPIEHDVVNHLRKLCEDYQFTKILEIGSGWGMSTRTFLEFAPKATVTTIDKIPAVDRQGYLGRIEGKKENLTQIIGDAKLVVPNLSGTFDLVYVDGSHDLNDVQHDLANALQKVEKHGMIVVDDVLHVANQTRDYGVLFGLREFLLEHKLQAKIVPVGHGQAVIQL